MFARATGPRYLTPTLVIPAGACWIRCCGPAVAKEKLDRLLARGGSDIQPEPGSELARSDVAFMQMDCELGESTRRVSLLMLVYPILILRRNVHGLGTKEISV